MGTVSMLIQPSDSMSKRRDMAGVQVNDTRLPAAAYFTTIACMTTR